MRVYDNIYINGAWVDSNGTGAIDVHNASTEAVVTRIADGTAADVELAVAAARAAFESWAASSAPERADVLSRIGSGLKERQEEIATTIAEEVGMPLKMAAPLQVGLPIITAENYAKILEDYKFEEQIGNSLVLKEPVGVVGCITPWNFPLHQIVLKLAPALAAGCTVVLKPSEVAPTPAYMLAEIIDGIGLPSGVFNLVSGYGPVVGEAIAAHPDVDMVSFTGSTHAGKRVAEVAAHTVKRVALELGGKSPNLILEDAELERSVKTGINEAFLNSGQACNAPSRMLAPRANYDEIVELAKRHIETFTVGDPFAGEAKLGPLISETQRDRVRAYIQKGIDEGARLVTGGAEVPEGLDTGYYVKPTLFADVRNDMTIAREEIFGPVVCIIPYEDEDEAVAIANDTIYGLGGNVWSTDQDHAIRVGRRIRTGQLSINGGRHNTMAPFGGYKQSGLGRENGVYGLDEYLEIKSLQL
jgi:betaine-aldehyde dehydrogenase